jgi:prepilin-type processing-associated H-X9-DG protein
VYICEDEVEGELYWPARAGNSWHPSEPQFRGVGWRRHQMGLQFAYVDGHVRFDRAVRGGRMLPRYSAEFDERYLAGYFPHAKLE